MLLAINQRRNQCRNDHCHDQNQRYECNDLFFSFGTVKIIHTIHLFRKISYNEYTTPLERISIMFVFLAIFIIFLLVINFLLRRHHQEQEDLEKAFWDRERNANFTRKKDISNLNYLIISPEEIPQNLVTDSQKALLALCGKKMLNLSDKTNTDLKLEYGVANLDELSACDARFSDFTKNAALYANELIEAGQTEDARALLEKAVSFQADNSSIYTQLAGLYQESGNSDKIRDLCAAAGQLSAVPQKIILEKLKTYQP